MGWSFTCDPAFGKAELVRELKNEATHRHWSEGVIVVATSVVGNNVWQVLEDPDGNRGICLTMVKSGYPDSGWGCKSIDESCGPREVNCPLSYLDMAREPESSYAKEWRAKVREYHATKRASATLKAGDPVEIYGKPYRLVSKRSRGWNVKSLVTGQMFRASKDYTPITETKAEAMVSASKQQAAA